MKSGLETSFGLVHLVRKTQELWKNLNEFLARDLIELGS
jgi:hypothetical protein